MPPEWNSVRDVQAASKRVNKAAARVGRHSRLETRQPLLYAALAFAGGIVVGCYYWQPASWWVIAAAVFSSFVGYLLKHRPRVAPFLALVAWFCLGAVNVQVHRRAMIPDISRFTNRSEVVVTAHVIHEGYLQEAGFGGLRQQIDVEAEEVQNGSETTHVPFKIRVGIFAKQPVEKLEGKGKSEPPIYLYGQRLRFVARLREPQNYSNPGSFDYRTYLQDNGIAALGSAKLETVEVLPGFSGNPVAAIRSLVHRRVVDEIRALASGGGGAHGCRCHWRRCVSIPQRAGGFPALGNVSHPRRFRHEREHTGVRHLLDSTTVAGE